MSQDPATSSSVTHKPPFYRRPLAIVGAIVIVVVLVVGVVFAITLLTNKPATTLADAPTNTPAQTTAPAPVVTPTPKPTPTPTPTHTVVHQAAPPPTKPKPPATKPKPPVAKPPITPTISGFMAAKAQSCSNAGVTHIPVVLKWTSTNGVRASLKSVSSYPATSAHADDTVITAINNTGQLNFTVPCTYAKVVYTLTLEYEATGAPQTYASASATLVTTS